MKVPGEDPSKGIDAAAGGLVWICRRNGSWWPGRILGPDELPEDCEPTPKLATPIKLLGREDASVDWYNLERSKRVKAFRCGEFDDSIAKAKASASHIYKKSVKYARRDDAILEALEIENARHMLDHQDLSGKSDSQYEEHHHVDQSPSSSHPSDESEDTGENLSNPEDGSTSVPELSHSVVSYEEHDHVGGVKEESAPPDDSEDDGSRGVKRMRGIEDLGMGVPSPVKGKRSQAANAHDFLRRKNRRRTLTKVLESTPMMSLPVACEDLSSPTGSNIPGASDSKLSELESNNSKKNNSVVINNSDSTGISCDNMTSFGASRRASVASFKSRQKENEISSMHGVPGNGSVETLFDVHVTAEEIKPAGFSKIGSRARSHAGAAAQSSQSSHVETPSLGNEEHNESGSTSSGIADIEKGTSKWQAKGKRNSRSRKIDAENTAETYVASTDREGFLAGSTRTAEANHIAGPLITVVGGYHVKSKPITGIESEEFRAWSWNSHRRVARTRGLTDEAPQKLLPLRQSRLIVNPKYDSSDFSLRHHFTGSGLHDITIQLETSSRPREVPYISLMSKLTGRPVVGQPLTVEVLDDGASNNLLNVSECYNSSSEFDDVSAACGTDMVYKGNRLGRPPSKSRTSRARRNSSKQKRNGLMSKKIRKLSSLTGSVMHNDEETGPILEKLTGPVVACVPINVVFSRINAAFSQSMRPASRFTSACGV